MHPAFFGWLIQSFLSPRTEDCATRWVRAFQVAPAKKAARNHPMFQNFIPSTLTRAIMAAFLFIAAVLPSQALQSGDFTYTATATAVTITGYTGSGGAVTISSSIAGLPVTSIVDGAFSACIGLTSISIPNSVTSIGIQAFNSCSGLTSVTIGSGVTSIGMQAFQSCTGLTSISIPNSVTSLGTYAFYGCSGLTSVSIGSGVTSMGNGAFQGCSGLTSVTISSGVTSMGNGAFQGCSGLTSILIPNSVTSLGNSTFSQCSGLTSVTIGSGVTSLGDDAFYQCYGLTSVSIGSDVTSIGDRAFAGCSGLTSVKIPNGVTSIESRAFLACGGLTSLTIPNSVTSIGIKAFNSCSGLTSVYFKGNAPTYIEEWYDTPATIYYLSGTTGWGSTFAGRPTSQLAVSISSQPSSVIALQGTRATFTVTAIGASGYQWQKNGVNIPLATTATLILSNVQQADATNYTVIVSNLVGDVTSDTATLTVLPDSDLDGLSDAAEAGYGTNPNNADSDGDGLSDRAEIQVYLSNALAKDTDGDGFEDGFEVSTGFNPAQASSSPDSVSTIGNAVVFRFNAGLGLSYRIEDSIDLQNWNTLETPIVGAGVEVTRYYPVAGQPKRYFRVKKNL
jgi:hypothetical protein